jgi:hypothetical protein
LAPFGRDDSIEFMNMRALTAALIVLALAACASTPMVTPTPVPTATPPPTSVVIPPPTTPPSPAPSPTPTQAIVPTVTPTVSPAASPTPVVVFGRSELVMAGDFREVDVALDSAGAAHVAAAGAGSDNRGIWYLTNASGTWTAERVTVPPAAPGYEGSEYDGEPSIAVIPAGDVYIAFTRWSCYECAPNPSEGTLVVHNYHEDGHWTEPAMFGGAQTYSPMVAQWDNYVDYVWAEGMVPGLRSHPVWLGAPHELWYQHNELIARQGTSPQLYYSADGRRNVLYARDGIRLVHENEDGTFLQIGRLRLSAGGFNPRVARDPQYGDTWAAWSAYDDARAHLNVIAVDQRPGSTSWSDYPRPVMTDADLRDIDVFHGVLHVIGAATAETPDALMYALGNPDTWRTTQIAEVGGQNCALALDGTGRPHIVWTRDSPESLAGVWYVLRPGAQE